MNRISQARIIFITGTDTGVGKTLLTGLLLDHLRHSGCHALAMKPFCSGSRADTEFLHAVQDQNTAPAGFQLDTNLNTIRSLVPGKMVSVALSSSAILAAN